MLPLTPDQTAQVIVLLFVGVILLLVFRRCRTIDGGWAMLLLYSISRLYIGVCFKVRSNRRSTYPPNGGAIIVANHVSPLDPVLLMQNSHLTERANGRLRVVSFMMISTYYDIHPVIGFMCRAMRSIPVDREGRDMGPVKQALRVLKDGQLLGIFPEAGINHGTGLLPADTGTAWLALTAKVPVIPVFIHNAPRGKTMVEPFFNFQRVQLSYGDPISLDEFYGQKKTYEVLSAAMVKIMRELGQLGEIDMTNYRCLRPGEERHTGLEQNVEHGLVKTPE